MTELTFVRKFLEKFTSKEVVLKLNGIIDMNININNFKYKFKGNKLIINEKSKKIITIGFDEVEYVEKNAINNIIINFKINEKVIIQLNE